LQVFLALWCAAPLSINQKSKATMSKLLDYMNHSDKNAAARTAHAANPGICMTNFGLTQDEQDALMSGDKQRLADAIGIALDTMHAMNTPNTVF
jgi:hypothetical protein